MSTKNNAESVAVGSWAKVVDQGSGEEEIFHIVDPREVDLLENKISKDNPMGYALLGSKPGEEVALDGPGGTVRFSVLEVGQL